MSAFLWPLSRTTVLDNNGDIVPGALLNFWVAGTTTPLTTYQDSALTAPHPNVIEASASGRFPAVYMTYTDYRQRARTPGGTVLFDDDGIANPAPASSGGGGSVPDDELFKTGDTKWSFDEGPLDGFVRLNGRTIGNAGSGATERANDDTEDLYVWLYALLDDTVCPVAGGRGANAAADYAAGKAMGVPDMRGRLPVGVDDMGNSSAGRLTGALFSHGSGTTTGAMGGEGTHTLAVSEMPAHAHPGSITDTHPGHQHGYLQNPTASNYGAGPSSSGGNPTGGTTDSGGQHSHAVTVASQGGGGAHNNMPPFILATWFIHL